MFKFIFIFLFPIISFCTPIKDWTVVIFMNGDNNLCESTKKDINELRKYEAKAANIILVYDCDKENDSAIYEIHSWWNNKKDITKKFTNLTEFDMGDSKFLEEISIKLFEAYPSRDRMLILWDHGSGWVDYKSNAYTKGISYDIQSGHFITTPELGEAIRNISKKQHITILGFDSCLMQMAEVIYEFAEEVDYTIGSEETIPTSGWDYRALSYSLSCEGMNPWGIGLFITDWYRKSIATDTGTTMSMIDNKKFLKFIEKLKELVKRLENIDLSSFLIDIPFYKNEDNKDLGYLLNKIPKKYLYNEYFEYLQTVVLNKATKPATGVSIYFPNSNFNESYLKLKFAQDTQWFKLFKQ